MPKNLTELAQMISKRDGISFNEAMASVDECATEMEAAFMRGSLNAAEDALRDCLGLELDYLDLFIN